MIVTSEGLATESLKKDPDFSLFHGLAHEIAHFWWNFGSGQGDWINETFAEYFSSVADQKILSEKIFRDDLARYIKFPDGLHENAPSLSSVPFEGGRVNYIVRYYKGSLLLDSLRKRVGNLVFFQICRDFYQTSHKELIGTPDFRDFWGKRLGENENILNSWLDSRGGIPRIPNGTTQDKTFLRKKNGATGVRDQSRTEFGVRDLSEKRQLNIQAPEVP